MDTISVCKSEVADLNVFELLLNLYNCHIISIEDEYYIIEGSPDDIEDFGKYWTKIGD